MAMRCASGQIAFSASLPPRTRPCRGARYRGAPPRERQLAPLASSASAPDNRGSLRSSGDGSPTGWLLPAAGGHGRDPPGLVVEEEASMPQRLSTGIAGLDQVLKGGL